jgi:mRNA interferase RelE/StbE
MYETLIERTAEKDLSTLPPQTAQRIAKVILRLKNNPRRNARKITGSENDWRFRIGDYRVIYEIDDKKRVIRIFRIKHRKDAYRNLW